MNFFKSLFLQDEHFVLTRKKERIVRLQEWPFSSFAAKFVSEHLADEKKRKKKKKEEKVSTKAEGRSMMEFMYCIPDLEVFIDKTIKKCLLEYDLDSKDTEALLDDLEKTWPDSPNQKARPLDKTALKDCNDNTTTTKYDKGRGLTGHVTTIAAATGGGGGDDFSHDVKTEGWSLKTQIKQENLVTVGDVGGKTVGQEVDDDVKPPERKYSRLSSQSDVISGPPADAGQDFDGGVCRVSERQERGSSSSPELGDGKNLSSRHPKLKSRLQQRYFEGKQDVGKGVPDNNSHSNSNSTANGDSEQEGSEVDHMKSGNLDLLARAANLHTTASEQRKLLEERSRGAHGVRRLHSDSEGKEEFEGVEEDELVAGLPPPDMPVLIRQDALMSPVGVVDSSLITDDGRDLRAHHHDSNSNQSVNLSHKNSARESSPPYHYRNGDNRGEIFANSFPHFMPSGKASARNVVAHPTRKMGLLEEELLKTDSNLEQRARVLLQHYQNGYHAARESVVREMSLSESEDIANGAVLSARGEGENGKPKRAPISAQELIKIRAAENLLRQHYQNNNSSNNSSGRNGYSSSNGHHHHEQHNSEPRRHQNESGHRVNGRGSPSPPGSIRHHLGSHPHKQQQQQQLQQQQQQQQRHPQHHMAIHQNQQSRVLQQHGESGLLSSRREGGSQRSHIGQHRDIYNHHHHPTRFGPTRSQPISSQSSRIASIIAEELQKEDSDCDHDRGTCKNVPFIHRIMSEETASARPAVYRGRRRSRTSSATQGNMPASQLRQSRSPLSPPAAAATYATNNTIVERVARNYLNEGQIESLLRSQITSQAEPGQVKSHHQHNHHRHHHHHHHQPNGHHHDDHHQQHREPSTNANVPSFLTHAHSAKVLVPSHLRHQNGLTPNVRDVIPDDEQPEDLSLKSRKRKLNEIEETDAQILRSSYFLGSNPDSPVSEPSSRGYFSSPTSPLTSVASSPTLLIGSPHSRKSASPSNSDRECDYTTTSDLPRSVLKASGHWEKRGHVHGLDLAHTVAIDNKILAEKRRLEALARWSNTRDNEMDLH